MSASTACKPGVQLHNLRQLPVELWTTWEVIQQREPSLASPYFTAGFAQLAGAACAHAEVGVLLEGEHPVGFFPFERAHLGVGRPLAGHLSDFQAVIAVPTASWTPEAIVKGCNLAAWDFDHMLSCQHDFERFSRNQAASPLIDLPDGWRGYVENRKAEGSKIIKHLDAMARKLEREVGALRFEFHCPQAALFEQTLSWKIDQYGRTGVGNVFAEQWTLDLLRQIVATQTATFAGVLSGLWAGSRLIAAHLGMRSRSVWHYWFPAYDPAYSKYSPGLLLVLEMIKAAESHQLRRIDLGKGDADYKTRLMTGTTGVLEGSVVVSPALACLRRGWSTVAGCVRRSPLRGIFRYPAKLARAWKQRRSFE